MALVNTSNQLLEIIKQKNSQKTIKQYARQCYNYSSAKLENIFLKSFKEEIVRCGFKENVDDIIKQFIKNPVLQTSHHNTPTNGPVFTAIDLISLLGLEEKYYLVGTFNGLVFSNTAWSGCISHGSLELNKLIANKHFFYNKLKKEETDRIRDNKTATNQKIRLIKSSYRDDLVFKSTFEKYRTEIWQSFQKKTLTYFPIPKITESASDWSLRSCIKIQSELFKNKNIIYFDLCRLIKNYLKLALSQNNNSLKDLLLTFRQIEKKINPIWFYTRSKQKKHKLIPIFTKDLNFLSLNSKTVFDNLLHLLNQDDYCPATFLIFFVLIFVQKIRCLGSFYQVDYINKYKIELAKILNLEIDILDYTTKNSLTTGKLIENGQEVYPLKYIFNGESIKLKQYENKKIECLWKT